jgi:hypothetical protein
MFSDVEEGRQKAILKGIDGLKFGGRRKRRSDGQAFHVIRSGSEGLSF